MVLPRNASQLYNFFVKGRIKTLAHRYVNTYQGGKTVAAIDWDFLIAWLLAPGFGLLTILYIYRRGWSRMSRADPPCLAYLGVGLLWSLGVLFAHPRIRDLTFFVPFIRLAPYLLAASPALLLLVTADLVRSGRPRWLWLLIVPALLLIVAALHDGALRPGMSSNLVFGARRFDRQGLWRLFLLTANLVSIIAAFKLSIDFYREGWGLVYRNRLRYWFIALALIMLGDLMSSLFVHPSMLFYLGGLVRLSGATVATSTLLIPYLPTTNQVMRGFLSILTIGLLTFGLLLAGILTISGLIQENEQAAVLISTAIVSALLALVYLPLHHKIHAAIDTLLLGHQTDLRNVLEEYRHQINQQLDLQELASVVVRLLAGALHLESETQDSLLVTAKVTDQAAVALTPIAQPNQPKRPNLLCVSDSALAAYWRESHEPLSQYDIEVLPDFEAVPSDERERLSRWGTKLYVPLRTTERLVGVLALGAKRSGASYNAAEIRFLKSLTYHTAVAIEQAQLLSDLKIANIQLTRLSDELAQVNRRLYEADQLKSGFISVITHELRSPFVPLAFSLQLIERHGLDHLAPEQREQLSVLKKCVTELKQMVDHIIAFASLLSKQGELNMEPLDLNQVIQDTVQSIQPMAESRQVSLDIRIWPSLPQVLGDQERMSEAIYHLIHNAIKFNNPGGWVRVRCQPTNGDVQVRVQDNGVGVPQDRLDNLWNAFTQMADPLRRGVEGLGLGLALVRYVAVSHGGEVWAESVEGQGSTFGFRVPALKKDAQRISLKTNRQPLNQGLGLKPNVFNGDTDDLWNP